MDLFNEFLDKAKSAIDVAVKVTEEAVDTGKQKFNLATLESKLSKDYKALGEAFYAYRINGTIDDKFVDDLIDSIKDKKAKISFIREEMRKAKADRFCPNCSAAIERDVIFCPICGQKLEFKTEDKEV